LAANGLDNFQRRVISPSIAEDVGDQTSVGRAPCTRVGWAMEKRARKAAAPEERFGFGNAP
jgi:hypothetical protein